VRAGVDVGGSWVAVGADVLVGISVVVTGTGLVVGIGASVGVGVGGIWVAVGLVTGTVWVSSPPPPQPTKSISAVVRRNSRMTLDFMAGFLILDSIS